MRFRVSDGHWGMLCENEYGNVGKKIRIVLSIKGQVKAP